MKGYCCDSEGNVLHYRLNGVLVYTVTMYMFYHYEDYYIYPLPWGVTRTTLYANFTACSTCACLFGIFVSLWFYARGYANKSEEIYSARSRCLTVDQIQVDSNSNSNRSRSCSRRRNSKPTMTTTIPKTSSTDDDAAITTFFLGREWNPRVLGVDVKMYLYLAGAVMLQLNICSAMETQKQMIEWTTDGSTSTCSLAMKIYVGCFSWFLLEYLANEEVHLYTYDLFAEKIGFKLVWGCLFFYPFFYCIGVHSLVSITPQTDISTCQAICIILIYFIGWIITRGANLQKFYARVNPKGQYVFCGCIEQRYIPGTHLLVSGFWGVSRHFNYFGEIVQALALALPGMLAGDAIVGTGTDTVMLWKTVLLRCVPLVYPLYYICLFVPRQQDDDRVCASKYGDKWVLYEKAVHWRIVPGVW